MKSLLEQSYWADKRDIETINKSIEHSNCFSVYKGTIQIAFARVVTDYCTFAYLADVIVDQHYRKLGIGKWLVDTAVNDPRWPVELFMLATDDAHTLYEKYGFHLSDKLMATIK
ncbi:GNAT family N-acetyltransferase [Psychromonas aquimarina]|uniref:GNAT family N-acetyltransferase n=1 Tax=Psychromonas aquimarina TaxID=444919 RepID=UPI001FE08F57|nr:GNAT family N-acetyltransferase [Psychromonas aquimarina]